MHRISCNHRQSTDRPALRRSLPLLVALALGACAVYRPQPLGTGSDRLSPPVAAVLIQDESAAARPFLEPATIDLGEPLDSNAVATLAVLNNPDLKAMRIRAGVADAQLFAAGLLPDPIFNLGLDHIVSGPDPVDNIAAALGLDINALRTRGVLLDQARAQAQQVHLDLAWAEWQTAGQARVQAVRVAGLERSLALARASRDAAQSLLDRSLEAAGRGDLPPDQLQATRLAAFDADERVRTAERDLSVAQFELARLLGLPPEDPIHLAPLTIPPVPPDTGRLYDIARAARYDLQALEAGYAAEEAAVHKAVLDQFPTLDLTINAARDTGDNRLIGPAIDFTLPLWNRNRGGIAIERATRDALRAEYQARLFQTRAEIAAAAGALAITRAQREAILEDLPALRKFAEASRRAADRGDLANATAETAEQALRDKQTLLAQAEQDGAEQLIALELLTGVPQEAWSR